MSRLINPLIHPLPPLNRIRFPAHNYSDEAKKGCRNWSVFRMQTVQHNRSNDYYRWTSSHDLPSQSQASHRHWWTSLATPVYFTLDHSPYLNRYGMVNPVHWVCFLRGPPRFINVRVGSGFVLSSFLSHLPSFLRQRCARCGGMVEIYSRLALDR